MEKIQDQMTFSKTKVERCRESYENKNGEVTTMLLRGGGALEGTTDIKMRKYIQETTARNTEKSATNIPGKKKMARKAKYTKQFEVSPKRGASYIFGTINNHFDNDTPV